MNDMTAIWILLGVWWLPIVLLLRARRFTGMRQLRWIFLLLLGGWFAYVFLSIEAGSVRLPEKHRPPANPDH